jgi:hypothetical protein
MQASLKLIIVIAALGSASQSATASDLAEYYQGRPAAIVRTERRVLPPIIERKVVEKPIIREEVVVPRVVTRRVVRRQVVTRRVVAPEAVPQPVFIETQVVRRPTHIREYQLAPRPPRIVVEQDSFEPRWGPSHWEGRRGWREGRWENWRDVREGRWEGRPGFEHW